MKKIWIVILFILLGVTTIVWVQRDDSVEIPEKLFGRWTTTDPRYVDRFFDLSESSVVFGVGDGDIAVYTTDSIQGVLEDGRTMFNVIFIDDEGVEYSQSLYFSKSDDNLLLFKNQNGVGWRKQTE